MMTAEIQSKKQENEQITSKSQQMVSGLEKSLQIEYQKEKEYIANRAVMEQKIVEITESHQKEKEELVTNAKKELEEEKQKQKSVMELDFQERQQVIKDEITKESIAKDESLDKM